MSRTFPHLSFRKRFLLLLLLLIFTICTILYFAGFPLTQERRFSAFTKKVFCSELEGNTLNLHYTVANPENYGIDPGEVSLGSSDLQSRMNSLSACENYRTALLTFDREALNAIADKALERKTGARGLRAIMEAVTLDMMYHIPSDESITNCQITKELVEEKLSIEERQLEKIGA